MRHRVSANLRDMGSCSDLTNSKCINILVITLRIFPVKLLFGLLPEANIGPRVLSLPACVCVCLSVCLSVCQSLGYPRDNPWPVQARITKFGSDVLKTLVKILIVLWSKSLKSKFTPFWACPHHNSSTVQARTTKFRVEMQNTLVQIAILGVV